MDNEKDKLPDEEMEFSANIISLTDEDGIEHSFELVDTVDQDGTLYVALIADANNPDMLDGDGNLVIMKSVAEENGEEILELIEDDDEFERISEIFMERLGDLYEFEELDDDLENLDID